MFCPKCGSILRPKDKSGKKVLYCSCGFTKSADGQSAEITQTTSEKKRIEIDMEVLDWIEQALEGMELCPITPRIAIQSTKLAGEVHGDPVDRMLIATAFEKNAVLVTGDKKILQYAKGKLLSAFNPL